MIPAITIALAAAIVGTVIGGGMSLMAQKIHFLLYGNKTKRIKEM